jgi:hypothetical protein
MKRDYRIYKVLADEKLEPMGTYRGINQQQAIQEMASRGVVSGVEWTMKYIAIPISVKFIKKSILF